MEAVAEAAPRPRYNYPVPKRTVDTERKAVIDDVDPALLERLGEPQPVVEDMYVPASGPAMASPSNLSPVYANARQDLGPGSLEANVLAGANSYQPVRIFTKICEFFGNFFDAYVFIGGSVSKRRSFVFPNSWARRASFVPLRIRYRQWVSANYCHIKVMCHPSLLLCVFAGTTDNFGMRNEPLMDTSKAVTDFMTNMANYRLSIILPTHTKDFMLKEPTCLNTPINLVLDLSN